MIAVTVERGNSFDAVGVGWRRTFGSASLKRSMFAGLTVVTIDICSVLAGDAVSALASALPHLSILADVPPSLFGIVASGLEIVFVAGYTLDVRMRSEGRVARTIGTGIPA